jgi:hypothetical protein
LFSVAETLGKSVEEVANFSTVELAGWSEYFRWKSDEQQRAYKQRR